MTAVLMYHLSDKEIERKSVSSRSVLWPRLLQRVPLTGVTSRVETSCPLPLLLRCCCCCCCCCCSRFVLFLGSGCCCCCCCCFVFVQVGSCPRRIQRKTHRDSMHLLRDSSWFVFRTNRWTPWNHPKRTRHWPRPPIVASILLKTRCGGTFAMSTNRIVVAPKRSVIALAPSSGGYCTGAMVDGGKFGWSA